MDRKITAVIIAIAAVLLMQPVIDNWLEMERYARDRRRLYEEEQRILNQLRMQVAGFTFLFAALLLVLHNSLFDYAAHDEAHLDYEEAYRKKYGEE